MGLILRIQPQKPFRLRNLATGQEATFEVRRSVTRANSWVLVIHDQAQLFGLGFAPRPRPVPVPVRPAVGRRAAR